MKKIILLPILIFLTAIALFIAISNYKSPNEEEVKSTTNKIASEEEKTGEETSVNTPITAAPVVSAELDLIITSPGADTTVNESAIIVKGKVNPKAYVIINEYDLTPGKDGSFEQRINLDEGENYISVVAYDDDGNSSERELLVVRTVEEI